MLNRVMRYTSLLLAVMLVLTALLLSALRLWTPTLAGYRAEIEAAAATALGAPVQVGRVEAGWRGLEPVLTLRDVNIGVSGPDMHAPGISELRVRPDILHLLTRHELRLSGIDLVGVSLTVVRNADGTLRLQGLPFTDTLPTGGTGLVGLRRLSLYRSELGFTDHQGEGMSRRLSAVTLTLQQRTGYLQLHGHARLPGEYGKRIDIDGRLNGSLADPSGWSGRLYLRGQSLALAGVHADLLPRLPDLDGSADLRLWLDLLHGRPVMCAGELDINGFALGAAPAAYRTDHLHAQFGWRRIDSGWQAAVQDVRVSSAADSHTLTQMSVNARDAPEGLVLDGATGPLRLDDLTALASALGAAAGPAGKQLNDLQLRGSLNGLHFRVLRAEATTTLQRFDATFNTLGLGPHAGLPALDGLDGRISGAPDAGELRMESGALSVTDARLFRAPLRFTAFDATLDWRRDDAGRLVVDASALHLGNDDLAVSGTASVQLPGANAAPQLDLQLAVERAAVARIGHYLPAGHMSPTGVAWLDRSLAGGTVHNGTVLIRGPLDKLPFDHGEGRLEVRLPVTGATLAYNPDWTPVTKLDAQVDFTGRSMDIRSRRGRIRSATLHGVQAVIRDLAHPHLKITGDVHGALPVMLAELGSSPLGDTYGGFVDRVVASGNAGLGLDIDVPLGHKHAPITVRGRIDLPGNRLQLRDSDTALDAISGLLEFDEHGIQGEGLRARLLERPVTARVWTEQAPAVTHVALAGVLPLVDQVLAADDPLRARIEGDSDWQIEVVARGQPRRGKPADVDLKLRSMLSDMAIDLPAPFGKQALVDRELAVTIRGLEQPVHAVEVRYGDSVRADLRLAQDGEALALQRGVVALGGVEPLLPDNHLLLIMGKLAQFRLVEWQPLTGDVNAQPALPLRLSLRLGELELFDHRLRDVGIEMHSTGQVYSARLQGEGAEGELQVTRGEQGIDDLTVNLQHLVLESTNVPGSDEDSTLVPDDFPALQFNTQRLVYDGADFGTLELQATHPEPGLLRIERLALSSDLLALHLSGDWRERDGRRFSSVDLEVTGGRAGDLLDVFGYQRVIKDGWLGGSLEAGWPGAPWDVDSRRLQGNMSLTIKNGQLLDVDPGAGRVLGLASLTALPKRLRLDFSDLLGKGFGFSRIGGNFVLDNGNAWTNNLVIDGPAARIDITGRVGLANEDYDEQVTVTPYLDSSLSIAGALAGGPAVGAAVLVADKLLEGKLGLNEMARHQYTVTGAWNDPKVTLMTPAAAAEDAADETPDYFE